MLMLNANYVVNAIVTKSIYVGESGKKMTTYDNVNGTITAISASCSTRR